MPTAHHHRFLPTTLLLLLTVTVVQCGLNLGLTDKHGTTLNSAECNPQTTVDFGFSTVTTATSASAVTNPASSTLAFLDVYGNDLNLNLDSYLFSSNVAFTGFVTGYSTPMPVATAAYVMKFTSGLNTVYLLIPVTSTIPTAASYSEAVLDLRVGQPNVPYNAIYDFSVTSSNFNAFNILDLTDYNLFYTATVGSNTLLVSNFVFIVSSIAGANAVTATFGDITTLNWDGAVPSTGDKLCHAAQATTGNTHLRESVPLWFIWFMTFFYWLAYLIPPGSNISIFDRKFQNNQWTCYPFYSYFNLAHEEFFTRLSRLTVLLFNWTIQGVFLASIYGNIPGSGPAMIIWTALIAFATTIPFPFLLGTFFLKKIYNRNLLKMDKQTQMKGELDRKKLEPLEGEIEVLEEKLYGYWHWYYAVFFMVYFICWPIAINQMQQLKRTEYFHHWYWLASMFVTFALEHFLFEPILIACFGHRQLVRERGGYYYNFRLGEAYKNAQAN